MKIFKYLLLVVGLLAGVASVGNSYNTNTHTTVPSDVKTVGDVEVGGNNLLDSGDNTRVTLGATTNVNANLSLAGTEIFTAPAALSVKIASNTITPSSVFLPIGSTGTITLTGAPTIATATATGGQHLVLVSTAATITFNDKSVQSTSGLCLSAGTIALSTTVALDLYYNAAASCWAQVH